ncbi:hypothetical protein SDC9_137560 [bioreactor metagenome]|uniref:Uncharacterized protein n=1 Tax=bioreactor metagenome TaxID=1076179 RepID=A0A645DMC2_9ZZZZ
MTHGGDHRKFRLIDGPGHPLVIEGPQVLHGPAAPARDNQVSHLIAVCIPDGPRDFRRGLRPLHPHRKQRRLGGGESPPQNAEHVVNRRPGGGGDDGNSPGIAGQELFMRLVEQALLQKLCLELLKGHRQIANPVRRQAAAVELIGPVSWEDGNPPLGNGLHAVFRTKPQPLGLGPKHDAPQRAVLILQRKIVVSRGVDLVVGQFSPHQNILQNRLSVQQSFHIFVYLGNLIDRLVHKRTFFLAVLSYLGKKQGGHDCPPRF